MNSFLWISLYSFYLNFEQLVAADHLIIREGIKFDTEQESLTFLLEIMTLVSANNTGSTQNLFLGEGHLYIYILCTTALLEMILGELHVSVYPSRGKKFWAVLGILLQLSSVG
jgi:hypothetical protein